MSPLQEQSPQLFSLLRRKLKLKNLTEELHLLLVGSANIVEDGYDNFSGQSFYSLYIDIPIELFVEIEDRLEPIEKRILKEVGSLRRGDEGNEHITAVTIRSAPDSSPLSPHLTDGSGAIASPAFWEADHFRIFISHVATYKEQARELKIAFKKFGVKS